MSPQAANQLALQEKYKLMFARESVDKEQHFWNIAYNTDKSKI